METTEHSLRPKRPLYWPGYAIIGGVFGIAAFTLYAVVTDPCVESNLIWGPIFGTLIVPVWLVPAIISGLVSLHPSPRGRQAIGLTTALTIAAIGIAATIRVATGTADMSFAGKCMVAL